MIELFEKKQIKDFSNKIKKVFNLLTISRKYKVIGSASLKNNRYVADYDLNELYDRNLDKEEGLDLIYHLFKSKFERALKDPNCFITDFKCGEYKGEPLRWDKKDMARGYKTIKGRQVKFQDCILQKAVFKLDVVQIINGVFTPFSDNYFIKLGKEANFDPKKVNVTETKENLKEAFEEYFYKDKNLFKGLKRAFSYYLIEGKTKNKAKLNKLFKFFNSKVGLLYKLKSELETIGLVIENKSGFRKPSIFDVKRNLKMVYNRLGNVEDGRAHLVEALKSNSLLEMRKWISKAEEDLYRLVNNLTLDFILENKDLPI